MSWVTDVVLLCDLRENLFERAMLEDPPAIVELNAWLEAGEWAPLVRFDDYIGTTKAFQAYAYGGAPNFLDIPAFLAAVAKQAWKAPDALLLLLKDEEEDRFTVYRMRNGELSSQELGPS